MYPYPSLQRPHVSPSPQVQQNQCLEHPGCSASPSKLPHVSLLVVGLVEEDCRRLAEEVECRRQQGEVSVLVNSELQRRRSRD